MRSLLVTPWFAAGAGVLIAATLALAAPRHAILSYGPIEPGLLCKNPHCVTARPAPGSLATARPANQLNLPKVQHAPAAAAPALAAAPAPGVQPSATPRPHGPADIAVRYVVLKHGHGTFVGVITVQSRRKLGDWSLGFAIPGARISTVWGAKWRPSADGHGGLASGHPSPWARSGPGVAKIVIFAAGKPRRPASCTFDGASCVFG